MKKFNLFGNLGKRTRHLFGVVLVLLGLISFFNTTLNAQCTLSTDDHIHVFLSDNNCDALFTEDKFLSDDGVDCMVADHYEYEIKDANGNILVAMSENVTVDDSYIGGIYNLKIEAHDAAHTILNTATLTFDVADKVPPTIDCPPVTDTVNIQCYQQDTYVLPISDNCSGVDSVLINEVITDNDCSVLQGMPATVFRRIDRTYVAIDASGNHSAPCTVHFQVNRLTDLEFATMIRFPEDLVKAHHNAIQCSDADNFKDADGDFDPNETGWPYLVYPDQDITPEELAAGNVTDTVELNNNCSFSCNLASTFTDVKVNTCPECIEKVVRFWTVVESSCQYPERFYQNIQTIEVIDTIDPTIIMPANNQVTTNTSGVFPNDNNGDPVSCGTMYTFPKPGMSDLCTPTSKMVWTISVVNDAGTPVLFADTTETKGTVQRALPLGANDITYTVYDKCGNSTSESYQLTVVDETAPIAICQQNTTVSLGNDGTGFIFAPKLNSGSYDECCPVTQFEVRRMDDPTFADYASFDCDDVNLGPNDPTVTVILRVYDKSGNYNDCMVQVTVQDKIPSTITCPPDITVQCDYPYDINALSDYFGKVVRSDETQSTYTTGADYKGVLGTPASWAAATTNFTFQDGVANDNCLSNLNPQEVEDANWPSVTQSICGITEIERKFQSDDAGTATCFQTISFHKEHQFNEDNNDIDWPIDYSDTYNGPACKAVSDYTPSVTGAPVLHETGCDVVGTNIYAASNDFVSDHNTDGTCFVILREWTVLDRCQQNPDGTFKKWSHTQVITVSNGTAPTFTTNCEHSEATTTTDCAGAPIALSMSAEDDCTSDDNLLWRYQIDYNSNGDIDLDSNDDLGATISGGTATVPSDIIHPIGDHKIYWTVWDQCGNSTVCATTFKIINKVPPVIGPVCGSALVLPLGENCEVTQQANGFSCLHPTYPCGDYTLYYTFDSPMPTGATSKTYYCDDVADDQPESLFVSVFVDGNWVYSSVNITIDVQDNAGCGCPPENSANGLVYGKITNASNIAIEGTTIQLIGSEVESKTTNTEGKFEFSPASLNKSYSVAPKSDNDYINGVSTLDLVQIQKHLLDIKNIESPYALIASDANNDNKISASDILMLRKLILGSITELRNNTSWKYIAKSIDFKDSKNPLVYNSGFNIDNLTGDLAVDFVAVKIGDINGDATINGNVVEARSVESIIFDIDNKEYSSNETLEIPVYAKDFNSIQGFQTTLSFDQNSLEFVAIESGKLNITSQNFATNRLNRGYLPMSWYATKSINVDDNEVLFTLKFNTIETGIVNNTLSISSDITRTEAYSDSNEKLNIELNYRNEDNVFALYQNRPNPFTNSTSINFTTPNEGSYTLSIFDLSGKLVYSTSGDAQKGINTVKIESNNLKVSGILYYTLSTENNTATRKMVVLK